MTIRIAYVGEATPRFVNELKLALYSLRKNGGSFAQLPVTVVINQTELPAEDHSFLLQHFQPLEIKVFPKLAAPPQACKFNAFYAADPNEYETLLFLDCDTVILGALDDLDRPIREDGKDFLAARMGHIGRTSMGGADKMDALVARFGGDNPQRMEHQGKAEWTFFNSGVFLATSDAVRSIRSRAVACNNELAEHAHEMKGFEAARGYGSEEQLTRRIWCNEQIALSLAVIESGLRTAYLPLRFNSGLVGKDRRLPTIFHCFRGLWHFDRSRMFEDDVVQGFVNSDRVELQSLGKTIQGLLTDLA